MLVVASIMPGIAAGVMAVLGVLSAWAGQRRQARGREYLLSRRRLDDEFKRPRDESDLL